MRCEDHMNRRIRICAPDDTVQACADAVRRCRAPILVVLDRDETVIGVATRRKLLSAQLRHSDEPVRSVMSSDFVICAPDDDLHTVARRLLHSGSPVVLVVKNDQVLGWLGTSDLAEVMHPRSHQHR